jgi:hypothetical protein
VIVAPAMTLGGRKRRIFLPLNGPRMPLILGPGGYRPATTRIRCVNVLKMAGPVTGFGVRPPRAEALLKLCAA